MLNELEVKVLNELLDRYCEIRELYTEAKKMGNTSDTDILLLVMYEEMGKVEGVLTMAEYRLGTTVELNWDMAVDNNIRKIVIAGYDEQFI